MSDNAAHNAVLARWERDKDKREALAKSGEENLGKFLKEALKNPNTLKNLAKQGVEVTKSRVTIESFMKKGAPGEGYNTFEEGEVTGFEPRPWEKE